MKMLVKRMMDNAKNYKAVGEMSVMKGRSFIGPHAQHIAFTSCWMTLRRKKEKGLVVFQGYTKNNT